MAHYRSHFAHTAYVQAHAPKWKVERLDKELEQLKEKDVRREKAEAKEGRLLARRVRQEKYLQVKEVRTPSPHSHFL